MSLQFMKCSPRSILGGRNYISMSISPIVNVSTIVTFEMQVYMCTTSLSCNISKHISNFLDKVAKKILIVL